MTEIRVDVQSLDSFLAGARQLGARLDAGDLRGGASRLSFETMDGLLKVITPNRWALLRRLRGLGLSSIRQLAKSLERDYRGVHEDVMILLEAGLVERQVDGKVRVPWSAITAEMSLETAA